MGNFEKIVITDRSKGNFTAIDNNILRRLDRKISAVSLGVLIHLLSLKDTWNLNMENFAKTCGCGLKQLRSSFTELETLKYLKREREKDSRGCFYTKYVVYEKPWDEIQLSPQMENGDMENPEVANYKWPATSGQLQVAGAGLYKDNNINNNIYKNNIDKNILGSDLKVTPNVPASGNSEPLNKPIDNLTSKSLVKNNTNLNNLENAKGCDKGCEVENFEDLPKWKQRQIERQQKRDKENEVLIEQEQNKPREELDNMVDKTMGDLTSEDNILSQAKKLVNKANEDRKIAEMKSQKKTSFIKRVHGYIDKDIQNQELAVKLKDYFKSCIDSGMKITQEIYKAQIDNLIRLSRDPNEQLQIVQKSIQKGWHDFYSLKSDFENIKNQPVKLNSNIKQEELESDMYELATDENGNPLVF